MIAYHHSQKSEYRAPFGAAEAASCVRLHIDAEGAVSACVRLWIEGEGEKILPMEAEEGGFSLTITLPQQPGLVWYYFILTDASGETLYYGNNPEHLGGEGAVWTGEVPGYQITVYRPWTVPDWYQNALFYQIFPDRFCRGQDWEQRVSQAARADGRTGPRRILQQDWSDTPFYTRDSSGAVSRWPFFGGTLSGICEKLDYLRSLGVTALYLNPIFQAASNHRYDTADYFQIDPMLGDEAAFRTLAQEAEKRGISLMLDGVFSHTGADSVYFDRYGNYGGRGAYGDPDSPYRAWYQFREERPGYECWWGVEDLPNVKETEPSYQQMICGENGVLRHWLRSGARGWRLDVADELPDAFIAAVRQAVKAEREDGVVIGEVWEDASNKISYDVRRRYLLGDELDGTMNYPFRSMMIAYLTGGLSGGELCRRMLSLQENYPPQSFYGAFNLIGGHDRSRILTVLGNAPENLPYAAQEEYRLSPEAYALARRRLKVLSTLLYTSPGVPCLYYGDEAGSQGYPDPFNRGTYPWGREDQELLHHFRMLGTLYHEHPALKSGDYVPFAPCEEVYGFWRRGSGERLLVLTNRSMTESREVSVPAAGLSYALELLESRECPVEKESLTVRLAPCEGKVFLLQPQPPVRRTLHRGAGVLCPLSALPLDQGFLAGAKQMVDFLQAAGCRMWQILPLNPPGLGRSPYMSPGTFAGDASLLREEIPLSEEELAQFAAENRYWLEDYALFTALRAHFDAPWQQWPREVRERTDLAPWREKLKDAVEDVKRRQAQFFRQWDRIVAYAHEKGICLIGDLPIYVAADSADTWAHRRQFLLDEAGYPTVGAGVPPDYFAPEGQNWGNPLYDWAAMRQDGYRWWQERLRICQRRFDYVRIDHFRSFSRYFAIPAGQKARQGQWQRGEGLAFFQTATKGLDDLGIIAEDLGSLDAGVGNLLKLTGFPGMNVWQFSAEEMQRMDPAEKAHRIFYSGTHDNQTLLGWCRDQVGAEKAREEAEKVIRTLYEDDAPWVIFPLQDLLGLGDEARLNVPGTPEGNWCWQVERRLLSAGTAEQYRRLAKQYGR